MNSEIVSTQTMFVAKAKF